MVSKLFPNHPNTKPNPMEFNFAKKVLEDKEILEEKEYSFHMRSVVGSLQWLENTRMPDIAYVMNTIATHLSISTLTLFKAADRIVRYL